jgi:hypothetical protein
MVIKLIMSWVGHVARIEISEGRSRHIDQLSLKTALKMGMLGPLLNSKGDLPSGTESCYRSSSSAP